MADRHRRRHREGGGIDHRDLGRVLVADEHPCAVRGDGDAVGARPRRHRRQDAARGRVDHRHVVAAHVRDVEAGARRIGGEGEGPVSHGKAADAAHGAGVDHADRPAFPLGDVEAARRPEDEMGRIGAGGRLALNGAVGGQGDHPVAGPVADIDPAPIRLDGEAEGLGLQGRLRTDPSGATTEIAFPSGWLRYRRPSASAATTAGAGATGRAADPAPASIRSAGPPAGSRRTGPRPPPARPPAGRGGR